jgi:hypothetical protein
MNLACRLQAVDLCWTVAQAKQCNSFLVTVSEQERVRDGIVVFVCKANSGKGLV